MKSDKYKVARAIRGLEDKDVCHEYFDVFDYGVEAVLSWYGISTDWTVDEIDIVKEFLLNMAYKDEMREVIRITEEESDPLLALIPDKPIPSLKLLVLEHEIWKKEMRSLANSKENLADRH